VSNPGIEIDRETLSNGRQIVKPMQDLRVRPDARLLKKHRPERLKHCPFLDGHGEIRYPPERSKPR
jgi:hypothetical protein